MGVQLTWQSPPADSDWESTEIHRSTSESGTYSLIETQALPDTSFYDCDGLSTSWYKVRFISTTGSCSESDYSDAIQGVTRKLYADPTGVLQTAGLTLDTLPSSITVNTIYNWIYDISRNIDKLNGTIYGRIEAFEEYLTSSKYLDIKRQLKLPYKPVSDVVVQFRTSIDDTTYTTLNEFYDYEVDANKGRIHLYRYPLIAMRTINDIKVNGNYGQLTIPIEIRQLIEILTSIKIFVHVTGGTYNDVTSYTLGEFTESLGEPYVNLREGIKILENDKRRLMQQTGISDKKIDMRLI